jgi:hypothetical protein
MSLAFSVKTSGDFLKKMQNIELSLRKAVTLGVRTESNALKEALRADALAGGLGPRFSKTWQNKDRAGRILVFPSRAGVYSMNAATTVYSKAPKLASAFDEGAVIRVKGGGGRQALAIPTKEVPLSGKGRRRLTPLEYQIRYGWDTLEPVFRDGRPVALVAQNARASYEAKTKQFRGFRFYDQSRKGVKARASVVLYYLVPAVRLRKRLHIESVFRRHAKRLPYTIRDIRRSLLRV